MFLLVPFILIIGSAAGIAVIVYRKMPYLKKLTPENHEVGETMFHDLFPELAERFERIDLHKFKQQSLKELEKLLRKLRVASLKIDHAADTLIKRIRHIHLSAHLEQVAQEKKAQEEEQVVADLEPQKTAEELEMEVLKDHEQKLIIEIAQNPKNPQLYEALGDLYLRMHNQQDARESYEAALGLDPSDEMLARKYSKLLHPKPDAIA